MTYFRTGLINVLCGMGTFGSFDLRMGNRKLFYRIKNEYVYSFFLNYTLCEPSLGFRSF